MFDFLTSGLIYLLFLQRNKHCNFLLLLLSLLLYCNYYPLQVHVGMLNTISQGFS